MTMTTRITQLENRGAAVAWSPIGSHADFIALGAKVCAFDVEKLGHFLPRGCAARNASERANGLALKGV